MTEHRLVALDGATPGGYLAAVGVAALVEGARVRFDELATPILEAPRPDDALAEEIVTGIEALSAPDTTPLPERLHSTTPAWSELSEMCHDSWRDAVLDGLLRTFDIGSHKPGRVPLDPQVRSGSLVLVSGKSYVRKSAGELWPEGPRRSDPARWRADRRASLLSDALALLRGAVPSIATGVMGLRFTASEASPRLRRGTETAEIVPLVEGLALVGVTRLLPGQRDASGRPGLWWSLNDVPLTVRALVDIHEQRAAPRHWPTFTARVRVIGGGTKASSFVEAGPLEEP